MFERDLSLIRVGLRARTELASVSHPIEGQIASIGAVVSEAMRTAPVRITCAGILRACGPACLVARRSCLMRRASPFLLVLS